MVESVGKIIFRRQKNSLEYYVFGDEQRGFGIRITQRNSKSRQSEQVHVTHSREKALAFARCLAKGTVFPQHLRDILEDWEFCASRRRSD